MARTLLDLVRDTVTGSPDRLAIDADDGQLTHAELFDAARALAGRLKRLGIGPGDRVGVHVRGDAVDLYVAIIGVLEAGAAYVPVDAGDPPGRVAAIWEASGAVAVLEPGLIVRELRAPAATGRPVSADDEAWVTYVDGPGAAPPFGVAVTHRDAIAFVEGETPAARFSAHDRVLAALPEEGGVSHAEMWLAWRAGAVLVPAPGSLADDGSERRRWLAERRVSAVLAGHGLDVQSTTPE